MRPASSFKRFMTAGLCEIHFHSIALLNRWEITASSLLMVPGAASSFDLNFLYRSTSKVTIPVKDWSLKKGIRSTRGANPHTQSISITLARGLRASIFYLHITQQDRVQRDSI